MKSVEEEIQTRNGISDLQQRWGGEMRLKNQERLSEKTTFKLRP